MYRLFVLFFLCAAITGHAQVKLEEIVKPGTKLIYTVKAYGDTYDFIVTVKDLKGSSFDWEMTNSSKMHGTIHHTDKALQNGFKMFNYFQTEERTLDDVTLSVWLSQKIIKALIKGDAIKICMNSPTAEPATMKQFMDGEYAIKVDGNGYKMYDKWVKPAKKVKDKWIIDPTSDDNFTYYNSATLPIILRMHTDFELALREVKTK
ncbi:MAG: hypothetical protein K0Q79_793 [Flavipsychrobacter sp.]|jgi:hypothetical protein|nr:hypothetical protein [Flavipsychrobacter sp.]